MKTKVCPTCKLAKPLSEFYSRGKSGLHRCKGCHRAKNKKYEKAIGKRYYHRHKEERRDIVAHQRRQRVYGISKDLYEKLLTLQAGFCPICKQKPATPLCVDHDHVSGRVRGLICSDCNRALGLLRESPEVLETLGEYLQAKSPEHLIFRKIEFDAGHRLMRHESKCQFIHGHRYCVRVYAKPLKTLDSIGRVVDFSILKQKLGGWIDEHFDHNMILNEEDTKLITSIRSVCKGGSPYLLPYNPTAENIALYLLREICPKLFLADSIKVVQIRVDETPNCSAVVRWE